MHGRRLARLAVITICNGALFAAALRFMLHDPSDTVMLLLASVLCLGCIAGLMLEILLHELAPVFNIGLPAFVTALMLCSIAWTHALALFQHVEYPAESSEAAGLVLLLSGYPLCLTVCVGFAYWLIDVSPDRGVIRLGLR
jgi:hypothetical protein